MFIISNESDINSIDKYEVLAIAYTEAEVQDYLEGEEHSRGDEDIYVHEFSHSQSLAVQVVTEYNLISMF